METRFDVSCECHDDKCFGLFFAFWALFATPPEDRYEGFGYCTHNRIVVFGPRMQIRRMVIALEEMTREVKVAWVSIKRKHQ